MLFIRVLLSSLLAASAWAAPGNLCKKGACNADNCLRAVRATSASPFPSSATADCSSFLQQTVTPCAATSTATTTVTVTHAPAIVTFTDVIAQTQLNTVQETIVSVATSIFDTATIIQPTEVDVTIFSVQPITITAAVVNKRSAGLDIPPLPTVPALIQVRAANASVSASTCPATTNAPSKVPTYASACSGTVRYSSACSCAGITATTTTIPQSTVTTTTTSTVTVTPTSIVTNTVINTVPVTVVQTDVIPTTFETTTTTVVIPSAFTVTTEVIVPTTVVVSPPVCSSYQFVATSGPRAGQFLGANDPASTNAISYGFLFFTDASNAKSWNIRTNGDVYSSQNVFGWVTRNNPLYYVLEMTDMSESVYQINYIKCSVSIGASSFPGAVGLLSCTFDNGTPTNLVSCASTGSNMLQAPNPAAAGNGCFAVNLAAIPSC